MTVSPEASIPVTSNLTAFTCDAGATHYRYIDPRDGLRERGKGYCGGDERLARPDRLPPSKK